MIVLIAEKPSFGADLARIIGAKQRHDGYIDGGTVNGEALAILTQYLKNSNHVSSQTRPQHLSPCQA